MKEIKCGAKAVWHKNNIIYKETLAGDISRCVYVPVDVERILKNE